MSPVARFLILICVFAVYANAWPANKQPQPEAKSDDDQRLELIDSGYLQGQVCAEDERLAPGSLPQCEPTCKNPDAACLKIFYSSLDYTPCFCKAPKVRDTVSKKCVLREECPK